MTNCKVCNTFQSRLKKGGLCDNCYDMPNQNQNNGNQTMNNLQYGNVSSDGMNEYFLASMSNNNMLSDR